VDREKDNGGRQVKCARCSSRPAVVFAFHNGLPIYACRRHWREVEKDGEVEWMRLANLRLITLDNRSQ
jgi:hypothetical protein